MFNIKKTSEDEKQIVLGEIYIPGIPDAHGDFMTADEIEKMAYDYMRKGEIHQIDVSHDNELYGCFLVESFLAREGDPTFIPGSWVGGVHIPDTKLWKKIKNKEINGFSMEVLTYKRDVEVELELPLVLEGETLKIDSGHVHKYTVFIDEEGKFVGGKTDVIDGHYHEIEKGSVTEESEGHRHKFSFPDVIVELGQQIDVQDEAED